MVKVSYLITLQGISYHARTQPSAAQCSPVQPSAVLPSVAGSPRTDGLSAVGMLYLSVESGLETDPAVARLPTAPCNQHLLCLEQSAGYF